MTEEEFLESEGIPNTVMNEASLENCKGWLYLADVLRAYKEHLRNKTTQINLFD